MIDPKAAPIDHQNPLKRVNNLLHPGARHLKLIVTRKEVDDNLEPVPHSKFYDRDFCTNSWVLKDEYR